MRKLLYILLFIPLALFGQDYNSLVEDLTIQINLIEGWNMIGYTCQYENDAEDMFLSIEDEIIIVKNNSGNVFMPEFGFNGIGNLIPGLGYQIKLYNPVSNFSLNNSCVFYGCTSGWADNYNPNAVTDDGSCYLAGCPFPGASNFDPNVTIYDGSCDSLITPEMFSPQPSHYPWYMLYFDNVPLFDQFAGGEMGAFYDFNGDGILERVGFGEILAGFFPLLIMANDASNPGVDGVQDLHSILLSSILDLNISILFEGSVIIVSLTSPVFSMGGGQYSAYSGNPEVVLTSSVSGCTDSIATNSMTMYNGVNYIDDGSCIYPLCMDSLACNYNPEVNQDNGSCEYAELGYDCDGNINVQIGDEVFGGIVFYVDSTGEHGLVAALEDLEATYQWGCYGTNISGANGTAIGTGYQNTLDIVAGCSETPIAASEALAYESEGYTDWFLPSLYEFVEMFNTIGNPGLDGNIGGFETIGYPYYWTSSEYDDYYYAWYYGFDVAGMDDNYEKDLTSRVRVIRSF